MGWWWVGENSNGVGSWQFAYHQRSTRFLFLFNITTSYQPLPPPTPTVCVRLCLLCVCVCSGRKAVHDRSHYYRAMCKTNNGLFLVVSSRSRSRSFLKPDKKGTSLCVMCSVCSMQVWGRPRFGRSCSTEEGGRCVCASLLTLLIHSHSPCRFV